MVDPTLLNALHWPLPQHPDLAAALLACWREPHRRYHDVRHLAECLDAGTRLGANDDALLALWFHDAVQTNSPGDDEAASAALAQHRLACVLSALRVAEIVRLVLVTEHHAPAPGDDAGAVVSDADLWILGSDPGRYAASVEDLMAELGLSGAEWAAVRRPQLRARLSRPIFTTEIGRRRERAARANLCAELARLGG